MTESDRHRKDISEIIATQLVKPYKDMAILLSNILRIRIINVLFVFPFYRSVNSSAGLARNIEKPRPAGCSGGPLKQCEISLYMVMEV